jgi:bifunctional pyridoxal-dependent enzyme with beta-cystathionase and maltose regulon repressor activities
VTDPTLIPELQMLDQIERISDRYRQAFGAEPFNVSHWDPSPDFTSQLLRCLILPPHGNICDYIYSYMLNDVTRVLERLGFSVKDKGCLITPNGTTSLVCVARWLNERGIQKVKVTCPTYFPVFHLLPAFGIQVEPIYLLRTNGVFYLPNLSADRDDRCAIWLTSPVYSAGVYFSEAEIAKVAAILNAGRLVIADECFAIPGRELSRYVGSYDNFVGIYAPHKSICVNGLKFSAIVYDSQYALAFDQWADILYGGLALTTVAALKHFTSPDYERCQVAAACHISKAMSFIKGVATSIPRLSLDQDPQGILVTCYFPHLPAELTSDDSFLWSLAEETGAVFIPGIRNHFDPHWGLSFRVNLARDSKQFRGAVERMCRRLGSLHG